MLKIFICDDEPNHLALIKTHVENYILMSAVAMEVVCAAICPFQILKYLEENPGDVGLYFLDLHLSSNINGVSLAASIRKYDPRGFIVFITSDVKSYKLTFKYRVEAMDYIVKSDIELKERITECLNSAMEKFTAKATVLQDNFVIKISEDIKKAGAHFSLAKDSIVPIEKNKIICFMTDSGIKHTVIVYSSDGRKQFAGSLKQVEAKLKGDRRFFRCQNNLIVNLDKIIALDSLQSMLVLENNINIGIAVRKVKKLNERINHYNESKDNI